MSWLHGKHRCGTLENHKSMTQYHIESGRCWPSSDGWIGKGLKPLVRTPPAAEGVIPPFGDNISIKVFKLDMRVCRWGIYALIRAAILPSPVPSPITLCSGSPLLRISPFSAFQGRDGIIHNSCLNLFNPFCPFSRTRPLIPS